jgi:hypothetical protein
MARYTGAWARKAQSPTLAVPLVAATDPQHLKPDPNLNPDATAIWVQGQSAPTLPSDLMHEPFGVPIGGGGPVDHTPQDHSFGVGGGHGLTDLQSQDQMLAWHELDLGSVAATQYNPLTSREDAQAPGNGPHVAIIADTPGDGDSPQTLTYQRTGVGTPIDPYARTGKRQKRWWNRFIDMHWFDVTYRPMVDRYAVPQMSQPAVPGGTQLDSPYASNGPMRATPDGFVYPQERRTPVPWDQPLTQDPSGYQVDPTSGLTAWGL